MFFSKSLFVLAAAVAVAVNAQSSSPSASVPTPSTGLISNCVLGCVEPAARLNNCTSFTDLPCVCQNGQFQADAAACLQQHCPTEYQAAVAFQATACTGYSVTGLTATPTPRTGIFTSLPATQTGTVPNSSGSGSIKPTSTTTSSPSPTSSTSTGTTLEAGVAAFFGAILAAVFAL